jgi:tetratricopeptide (TPR) repeat protein
MTAGESHAARAKFHLEMGRLRDARAELDAAEAAEPRAAAPYDVEALLADRENRADDARKAYGRAMESGSASFYTYFRWAAQNLPAAASDAALRAKGTSAAGQAAVLDKLYAPALAQLATVTRMNGNKEDAVAYAERAVELAPGNAAIERVLDIVKR